MTLTVSELLFIPEFKSKQFTFLAGASGANRIVRSVSVMDAPDIHRWLRGGEVLITTGYIMKDDPMKLVTLIQNINRAGAAALMVKMNRFIFNLPQEAVMAANSLGLPIISMPIDLAFTDVINPALSQIVNRQAALLKKSESIYRSFTKIALEGGQIDTIITVLSQIVAFPVGYLDKRFFPGRVVASSSDLKKQIEQCNEQQLATQFFCYAIEYERQLFGYLLYDQAIEEGMEELQHVALDQASIVLKLTIQRRISNIEIENRYRNDFIYDIVHGNIKYYAEMEKRSRLYGWHLQGPVLVLAIDIDDFKKGYISKRESEVKDIESERDKIFDYCVSLIGQTIHNPMHTRLSDRMVLLMTSIERKEQGESIEQVAEYLANRLVKGIKERFHYQVTIGIGTVKQNIIDAPQSLNEAEQAVRIGRELIADKRSVVFYRALSIYRLFEPIYRSKAASEFVTEVLNPIIIYDREHRTEFVKTLQLLIDNGWHLRKTASQLFIHYSTMKYRYKKIEELLGCELSQAELRLKLAIAWKLFEMDN